MTEPHRDEAVGRKVGLKKSARGTVRTKEGFGGEVSAANSAFHGGGPASLRPIAREKQAGNSGLLMGTPAVNAGFGGEGGGGFLDDSGFKELRFAGARESVVNFGETEVDDVLA